VALSGLAFNQAIRPFRSFAGIVFLAVSTYGPVESRAIGSKSLSKSYESTKVAPANPDNSAVSVFMAASGSVSLSHERWLRIRAS
jgi:hypothetical protein